jgi:hypothetical protein
MTRFSCMLGAAAMALAFAALPQAASAGGEIEQAIASGASAPPAGWAAPRTPWGDPDLRGIWPLDQVGRTPTERPVALGTKAYLSDEEYRAALDQADHTAAAYAREDEADKIGSGHWFEWGRPLKQTSLIMEPANGRVPPLTEEGRRRAGEMRSSWSEQVFDKMADFNSLDLCISRGLPATMTPFAYNNGIRVWQTPGYVALQMEMVHETRIVPLGDGERLPANMRQWLGTSRGHWEGDTLVIETTNLTGKTPMNIVGGTNGIPTSTEQRVVERLTLVGPDTIYYEATIDDPTVLTAPFKMAFPWTRKDDYQLFEYACHEGNTVVRNYIQATSPRFNNSGEAMSTLEWLNLTVVRDATGQ